ncbi:MAG: hypothetical protein ABSH22_07990 [Tepidisphaeraceae bacterium]|jgi:hypothetical protein
MNEPISEDQLIERHPGGPVPAGWVKLSTFGSANDAEIRAAVLAGEGIRSQIFGANINAVDWAWQVFNDVDLIVQEADVERATAALSTAPMDDLEPAEEAPNAPAPVDEHGNLLVPVAAYETPADLRDGQTVLASEHIAAYGPRLVLRGDKPAGVGARFILRVAEKDMEAAQALLAEEADENKDEPRCPRCGSWQVISRAGLLKDLANAAGLSGPGDMECMSCHYRAPAGEFLQRDEWRE